MPFTEGQTVVHPFHGPVQVTAIREKEVRGSVRRYVQLESVQPPMTISVPVTQLQDVGVREVSSPQRIAEMLDLLGGPRQAPQQAWARRVKDLQARMTTGRPDDLCYVVREITRSGPKAPASAEGMMLREARARLAAEFSLGLQVSIAEAESIIHTATHESLSA